MIYGCIYTIPLLLKTTVVMTADELTASLESWPEQRDLVKRSTMLRLADNGDVIKKEWAFHWPWGGVVQCG